MHDAVRRRHFAGARGAVGGGEAEGEGHQFRVLWGAGSIAYVPGRANVRAASPFPRARGMQGIEARAS